MKRNLLFSFFLFISLSFKLNAASFEEQWQALKNQLPSANVALVVQDLQSGKILYESRAKEHFYPASNTKLFTAAAALKKLGKDYQIETSLYGQGDNIYLSFRGDPSFSSQDLYQLLQNLQTQKISTIKGHFIIDDTAFDNILFAPGWTRDSTPWYYAAPVHAIMLNENKARFSFQETKNLGQKIAITQKDKSLGLFKLSSNVTAVTTEKAENHCTLRPTIENNEFTLNGCWPLEKTPTTLEMAIDNPRLAAASLINAYLRQLHIELAGNIVFAKAPQDVTLLASHKSPPLEVMLSKVLADSNNLYTESLTKTLGATTESSGSFQAGTRAIKNILKDTIQLNLSEQRLSDGSGQSRYNLVTPMLIADLLYAMYHDPLFNVFYGSLSVSGKTGSLSGRLKTKDLTGRVVAKTGSAIGTSALSGYLTGNSGKPYLFVIVINQATKDSAVLKDFEDKLCQILIQEPWLM